MRAFIFSLSLAGWVSLKSRYSLRRPVWFCHLSGYLSYTYLSVSLFSPLSLSLLGNGVENVFQCSEDTFSSSGVGLTWQFIQQPVSTAWEHPACFTEVQRTGHTQKYILMQNEHTGYVRAFLLHCGWIDGRTQTHTHFVVCELSVFNKTK